MRRPRVLTTTRLLLSLLLVATTTTTTTTTTTSGVRSVRAADVAVDVGAATASGEYCASALCRSFSSTRAHHQDYSVDDNPYTEHADVHPDSFGNTTAYARLHRAGILAMIDSGDHAFVRAARAVATARAAASCAEWADADDDNVERDADADARAAYDSGDGIVLLRTHETVAQRRASKRPRRPRVRAALRLRNEHARPVFVAALCTARSPFSFAREPLVSLGALSETTPLDAGAETRVDVLIDDSCVLVVTEVAPAGREAEALVVSAHRVDEYLVDAVDAGAHIAADAAAACAPLELPLIALAPARPVQSVFEPAPLVDRHDGGMRFCRWLVEDARRLRENKVHRDNSCLPTSLANYRTSKLADALWTLGQEVHSRSMNAAERQQVPRLPRFTERGFTKGHLPLRLFRPVLKWFYTEFSRLMHMVSDPDVPQHVRLAALAERHEPMSNGNGELNHHQSTPLMFHLPDDLRMPIENWFKRRLQRWVSANAASWRGSNRELIATLVDNPDDEPEHWALELQHTMSFGIRMYVTNSSLSNHCDILNTHVLSSIVHVASEVNAPPRASLLDALLSHAKDAFEEPSDVDPLFAAQPLNPWPLTFRAHGGDWHEVALRPGETVLYESARCRHGRPRPYKGAWYANFFMHFKPAQNWEAFFLDERSNDYIRQQQESAFPLFDINAEAYWQMNTLVYHTTSYEQAVESARSLNVAWIASKNYEIEARARDLSR